MRDADSILFSEMEVILKSPDFLRRNCFPSRVLMESRARIESLQARVEALEQAARLRFIKDVNGRIKELIEFAERSPDLWEYFKATNTDIVDELIEILAKAKGGSERDRSSMTAEDKI